jgi:DNA-directed RNA polymerase specialized sigma24 family protein
MVAAASPQAPYDIGMREDAGDFTSRAAFEAFFTSWLPRVHRFAARRLATTSEVEAATRAIFEAAVRARLVGANGDVAARLLAIAKAEVARRRRPRA